MRLIISDSSCLIDLRNGSLIEALLRLPYEIAIPDVLFEDELLSLSSREKSAMRRGGLKILEVSGLGVLRAREIAGNPKLSLNDGFAFALAEQHPGCVLLTGDNALRRLAEASEIEVHGVLWAIDEIHRHQKASTQTLLDALLQFEADPAVHLPSRTLTAYIRRYRELS